MRANGVDFQCTCFVQPSQYINKTVCNTISLAAIKPKTDNNKLSCRRETARRAMLINSCYVSQGTGFSKVSNSKVTFKAIQGHWQWCHSIGHIRFPIRLPFHVSILHHFQDIITYYSKRNEVTLLWTHPFQEQSIIHVLVHLCINQHMTFELASFTNSKDMIRGKI